MAEHKIFYGWFLVLILGLIYLINLGFPFIGASVANTYMAKALKLGRGTLGLGFTVYLLAGGLASPIIAYCIRKRGIRLTLCLGCLILALGSFLMASVVAAGWQYVATFGVVVGIGSAFGGLIPVQTGVTLWFKKKKALAMSIAITIGSLGGFIAPPILNRIITLANGNWRIAWYFIAGFSALSLLLSFCFVKNKPSDIGLPQDGVSHNEAPSPAAEEKPGRTGEVYLSSEEWKVTDAVKTATFWFLFVASLAFFAPMMMFTAHAVIYLRDMGHTPGTAAMIMSYYMLFSLLGRMLGGVLGDHLEPRYIWSVGLLLEVVGIMLFLEARSMFNIYLFAIFVGIGVGASTICMPILVGNYFGTNSFASILGILFPIVKLLSAVAPFLAGLAYDVQGSYLMPFIVSAALALIGSIVIFFTKPPTTLAAKHYNLTEVV